MIHWTKAGSVWIGIPDDGGTIRGGIRCYLIGIDSTKDFIGCWTLRVIGDSTGSEEVDLDKGHPAEAIERLQDRAEEHYLSLAGRVVPKLDARM